MTGPRTYGDPCGVARALDVVGERWSLLVVRELLLGPKRFTDLRGALGASPNVLTQRLGELEDAGVVQRRTTGVYELTDWGRELHPIVIQLGRWGRGARHRPSGELGVDSLVLALEATFSPEQAGDLRASYELRLGEERFAVEIDNGAIAVARGMPRKPDAIIESEPDTLREVLFGDRKLTGSEIEIRGDAKLGRTFFKLFVRA
jgi:DNA-binding HxlR family transcriptional regulator